MYNQTLHNLSGQPIVISILKDTPNLTGQDWQMMKAYLFRAELNFPNLPPFHTPPTHPKQISYIAQVSQREKK